MLSLGNSYAAADEPIGKLQHMLCISPSPQCVRVPVLQHKGNIDPKQYEMGVKKVFSSATFGKPLGLNHSSPDCFLKGHAREPVLPARKPCLALHFMSWPRPEHFTFYTAASKPSHSRIVRKDPVPKRQDVPQLGLHSNKNFVTANAVENILAHPPQRPAEFQ